MINVDISSKEEYLLNLDDDNALTREECINIFSYWGMGRRVASALPKLSFSREREIKTENMKPEVVEVFRKVARELRQDEIIKRVSIMSRVLGMCGLGVYCDNKEWNENLTKKDVQENDIAFLCWDTLNSAGVQVDQNPLSKGFQKIKKYRIRGKSIGSKRATYIYNGEPIYLKFNESTYTFAGYSVYQNMIPLIRSWVNAIVNMRRLLRKSSAIVFKGRNTARATGISAEAETASLQKIKEIDFNGGVTIGKDDDIVTFPMSGLDHMRDMIEQIEKEIMIALDDTPSAILLDKDLSNGLSEGSEDMKVVIMAIENYRKSIRPLYDFTDKFIMYKCWDNEFINQIKKDYPEDYADKSNTVIFDEWVDNFEWEFGNLYPRTEKEDIEIKSQKLDNLIKVKEMGADVQDIMAELQEEKIFKNDMEIKQLQLDLGLDDGQEYI